MTTYEDIEIWFIGAAVIAPSLIRIVFREIGNPLNGLPRYKIGRKGELVFRVIHSFLSVLSFFLAIASGTVVGIYLMNTPLPLEEPKSILKYARLFAATATAYSVSKIVESTMGKASYHLGKYLDQIAEPREFYNPDNPRNFAINMVISAISGTILPLYIIEIPLVKSHIPSRSVLFSILYMMISCVLMVTIMKKGGYQTKLSKYE